MSRFFLGVLATLCGLLTTGAAMVWVGGVDVAADAPHHPLTYSVLDTARQRAISRAASGIAAPGDLDDPQRVRRGAGNYAAMCAECHLQPGVEQSEIRSGLYPVPPDLASRPDGEADPGANPADNERFWVSKHGIKASGMAAWGQGGMTDGDIWDLVALLRVLPDMGPGEYAGWVKASDGHSHGGGAADHHDAAPAHADDGHPHAAAAPHAHPPGTPPHKD